MATLSKWSRGSGRQNRGFRLGLLIAVLALVAAACSSSESGSSTTTSDSSPTTTSGSSETTVTEPEVDHDPVTLNVLHNWTTERANGVVLQEVFKTVQEENPWITIADETLVGNEIPAKVNVLWVGGEEPDVVLQNLKADTLAWGDAGVSTPVTEMLKTWTFETPFKTAAIENYTFDGEVIAFPLEGLTWPIWYNTEVLAAAGVEIPTTMDELKAAIPAIRAAGFAPFVTAGAAWPGHNFFAYFLSLYMTDDDIRATYPAGLFSESAAAIKGTELWVELRDLGFFSDDTQGLDNAGMIESFLAGEAAMMHGGSWVYPNADDEFAAKIELAGLPIPSDSVRNKPIIHADFGSKAVWVTRNGSEKLDAVQKFVEVLFRPENIGALVEIGIVSPIEGAVFDSSKLLPLSVKALDMIGDTERVLHSALSRSEEVGNAAYLTITEIAFDPNSTVTEILEKFDSLFK